jgi:hypothetical protein
MIGSGRNIIGIKMTIICRFTDRIHEYATGDDVGNDTDGTEFSFETVSTISVIEFVLKNVYCFY